MATPRVFVSSTCYDLQEIRYQLRRFVEDAGYDPATSEFGDLFYELKEHVQDACRNEVMRCNIFILIIGNNYGSLYHRHRDRERVEIPDSVTLSEFRKALEVGIPKFIFVNKWVQHDFHNYRHALEKVIKRHFDSVKIPDSETVNTSSQLRNDFDDTYPFPQEAYRYVFHFLDLVYALEVNNAVFAFETFDDIRDSLKKQWAGIMYDALLKENTVPMEEVKRIAAGLERIENQVRLLAESKTQDAEGRVTFDIRRLASEIDIESMRATQERIDIILTTICVDDEGRPRFQLKERLEDGKTGKWLDGLEAIVNTFKWSKHIPVSELLRGISFRYWEARANVPYHVVLELYSLRSKLGEEDRASFSHTVTIRLNEQYVAPPEPTAPPPPTEDEIPF